MQDKRKNWDYEKFSFRQFLRDGHIVNMIEFVVVDPELTQEVVSDAKECIVRP